jgi:uncharacterized membrane protein (UPF0127 family)
MGRGLSRVAVKTPSDAVICSECEVADRALPRMKGLLGRDRLEPGTGMLIKPAPSVHMFFMRFPIDVVFIDRRNTIVGISHVLKPWRMAGARRAVAALELPAGTAARLGLMVGDAIQIESPDGTPA